MATKPKSKSQRSNRPVAQKQKAPKVTRTGRQDNSPADATGSQLALAPNEKLDSTPAKIFPRNLTARAQFQVVGNPSVTRPEDAVANCYPGLELDIRNLDRRFFPGLVFNFVVPTNDVSTGGAKLAYVDAPEDPDLQVNEPNTERLYEDMSELHCDEEGKRLYDDDNKRRKAQKHFRTLAQNLYAQLTDGVRQSLADGDWYLDWIKQGTREISLYDDKGDPLDGLTVWRLIRGLAANLVSIGLKRRDKAGRETLLGWRRFYTDPTTGVISGAYQAGELMQGLCSPWQHDFRDCYCHYWASNRPDLVFADVYPGEPLLPDSEAIDPSLNLRLDWMRADRSRELAVGAFGIIERNRPYQFDHHQINHEWQNLNIVVNNREIDSVHLAEAADAANPYESPAKLATQLQEFLAPLELTFVFEYLYARFSLRDPAKITNNVPLRNAVILAREYLLLIVISEMRHLRWGNEILWELHKAELIDSYVPVIKLAKLVPHQRGGPFQGSRTVKDDVQEYIDSKRKIRFHPKDETAKVAAVIQFNEASRSGLAPADALKQVNDDHPDARLTDDDLTEWRAPQLRPLKSEVQQEFINIESPDAFVDRTYARVLATLEQREYPSHLAGLARRILHDGMQHEGHFYAIQAALKPFDENLYLRYLTEGGVNCGSPAAGRSTGSATPEEALRLRNAIIEELKDAYRKAACDDIGASNNQIANARSKMNDLLKVGEEFTDGIPFFKDLPVR